MFIKKNIDSIKIKKLFKKKILHLSHYQRLSIFDFMKKISHLIGKSHNVIGVKDNFFNSKYVKPKNLGLKPNVKNFRNSSLLKFIYDT